MASPPYGSKKGNLTKEQKRFNKTLAQTRIINENVIASIKGIDFVALRVVFASGDNDVWADSAYRSDEQENSLKNAGLVSHIHERAYRGKALNDKQKSDNIKKSGSFLKRVGNVLVYG